ncbi:hypothetical protein B0I35DRAFT_437278 [Stachybotrys elegans]|uniref:Zn(2)-C6 fungal-type domain-containing protein n=1 Tax=Stachybotrys elegans TaxID=80388 RepID=A0A8K0WNJ4_9HYPO|nr:hypothetical protein B0I35DRAFT_437278 [Stachybotrys elegans]
MDVGSDAVKRRKVRKGTRSCWECRRRKVKCVFTSPKDSVCCICRRRNTQCTSQDTQDSRPSDLIDKNSTQHKKIPSEVRQATPGDDSHAGFLTPALTLDGSADSSPGFDLNPSLSFISTTPAKLTKITHKLLRALPSQHDLELLLSVVGTGPKRCSPSWNTKGRQDRSTTVSWRQQMDTLVRPDSHPVLLANKMLRLALALQYIGPKDVIPGLAKNHRVIMEEVATAAMTHVTTNEDLLGSIESLESIVLESMYHADQGNLRRSWVTMRRAVTAGHMANLHRPGHYSFNVLSSKDKPDPDELWLCVVSVERTLSLLLGLPTSTGTACPSIEELAEATKTSGNLSTLLMGMTGKVIERNQARNSHQGTQVTRQIDRDLVRITELLPPSYWRPLDFTGLAFASPEAYAEESRAGEHMRYFNLINQLHLPYVICPTHTPGVVYSRTACINASREILTRQIAVRTFTSNTACSRMGDFLALTAGMTLMLAHIASHAHKEEDNLLAHQRLGDRATIAKALECMESMSNLHEDVLARNCATVLKNLLTIEVAVARAHHEDSRGDVVAEQQCVLTIKVPYFGTMRIDQGGNISMTPASQDKSRVEEGGVSLGGVISICLQGQDDVQTGNAKVKQDGLSTTEQAVLPAYGGINAVQNGTAVVMDQALPSAAAGVNDWAFQGLDTAFFDALMYGVNIPEDGSTSTFGEGWENFS